MTDPVALLRDLVAARSPSREEGPAVEVMEAWLRANAPGAERIRVDRNLAAVVDSGVPGPTLLLVSHLDTVPATAAWSRDPWVPTVEGGRMYGLGANDAKGCCAAMAVAFAAARPRRGKLVLATVCEEEVGRGGLEIFLPLLPPADHAIVGEPTGLDVAVAQNGLLILDCDANGRAGHAARPHLADNAIYKAARDILALEALVLDRVHPAAGRTTHAVTVVSGGDRHNVIPDRVRYTVDLRTTPSYTHAELAEIVRGVVGATVTVRSDRFRPVETPSDAPVLAAALRARPQARTFASPTLSDWAHLVGVAAIKWGPGLSEVSHTADEWVELAMVEAAAVAYGAVIADMLGA
ncbi:MAG: M20/M25/M40 family metallo-hydrolase [Pseudomonadota bacterium]|nr:M20/M25/M40 family metallo-hydrolase [Pseudomonadota bacterium]